eukprot:c16777_g1_i3.p1 GENE.c16777_g1_i3~~c16777_g1_i3.p1  ORF type:complete len:379 (+),score=94.82 c16777_g1_i3:43-1137(+)
MITPKYTYNPYVHILAPDRNTNEAAGKVKVAWPITVVQFVPNCLCDLARMVVQVFHSPLATTIIDVIVDETFIKDSEIAERLKLDDKQVRQVLQELAKAKVVREHTTRLGTPRVGSQRPPEEIQHWYIDYMSLVDATQYRYHVMMQNIRNSHIHLMDVFKCPRCAKEYTEIEVVEMRSETHRQDCPKCGASIEQVEKPAVIPQHRAAQVEQQMAPIITKLEECQKWFKSEDLIHDDSKGITTFKSQLDANKHSAPRGRTATVSIPSRSRNSSQNGGDSGDGLAVNVTDDQAKNKKEIEFHATPLWFQTRDAQDNLIAEATTGSGSEPKQSEKFDKVAYEKYMAQLENEGAQNKTTNHSGEQCRP